MSPASMPATVPSSAARSVTLPVNAEPAVPAPDQLPVVPVTVPPVDATTPCLMSSTGSATDWISTLSALTNCCWPMVVSWVDCPSTVMERWSAKG